MNKHDFYKELMSEYSFDAEKIRSNAKKGKYARQKISPMAIGITTAVAACTVAFGTLAMTTLNERNGIDLVGENQSLSALSSSERVKIAIEQQNKVRDSEELVDVMVTFAVPLAPNQAEAVIAAHTDGNVPVKTVYLADGSRVAGSDQVAAIFNGSSMITGICIECPGSVMTLLQNDADIFLVELMSESDLDSVTPINPEDVDTLEVTLPEYNVPDTVVPEYDTTEDDNIVITVTDETIERVDTVESTEVIETTENPETAEVTETTDIAETLEATEEADDTAESAESTQTEEASDAPETTEPVISDTPDVVPALPEGIQLPTDPDRFVYNSSYISAESAYFISNNTIFVKTLNGFAMYTYFGSTETLLAEVECDNAKVHWVSDNDGKLIVSGVSDDGNRNKLWLVDAHSQSIIDLHAEDTVMDGTLTDVGYHAESGTVALVIKEYGVYYTSILKLNSNEMSYVGEIFNTEARSSLLSFNANTVYIAVTDGSLSQIHAVDINNGSSRIIKTYTGNPTFSKNLAFTHGLITPSASALTGSVEIFDPATESFISTGSLNATVVFGASKHTLSLDGSYYTVSGGALVSTGGINAIAAVDYKRSLSAYYAATADNGYLRITESIYNSRNKSGVLDFGHITSSNDAKFRDTLTGAIGVNNALARRLCSESGMDRLDELLQTLSVYYSENAVKQLKQLCSIPDYGALSYSSGGLTAISANDVELVISSTGDSTASGTLFIKAGSFGGKTAYRSISVTFVMENGTWKLDSIIGK
ncbi:MAG: hypothetical protein E7478_06415 [Ruminococcaceae bacterium]|nr:hypothetical protein [Oscillospiraceae bacterium]